MTIDEIEAFVSIARLGGFARAADSLHRSQPAISRRIEMLEEQLRTRIFERVRGGVVLTEAGRSFLPYAEAAQASLKDGTEAVHTLERGDRGTVSVVLVGTLASTKFAALLRQFGRRHPRVKLELRTATSQEVSELVRRGEATLGLRYFCATPARSRVSGGSPFRRRVAGASPSPRRSSSGSPPPPSRPRRSSASTASPRRSASSRPALASRCSSRAACRRSCGPAPSVSSTCPRSGAASR